jgi:predicted DNA repair protein MutK
VAGTSLLALLDDIASVLDDIATKSKGALRNKLILVSAALLISSIVP